MQWILAAMRYQIVQWALNCNFVSSSYELLSYKYFLSITDESTPEFGSKSYLRSPEDLRSILPCLYIAEILL